MPGVSPRAWADISLGVYLCRSITTGQATDRGYGDEREWHPRYCTRLTCESYHHPERIKKKEPEITPVNQVVLQHLNPEYVEVEIWRADELEVHCGLRSELDEMWVCDHGVSCG